MLCSSNRNGMYGSVIISSGTEDSVPHCVKVVSVPRNDDHHRDGATPPRPRGRQAEAAVNDGLILKAARDVLTVEPDTPMAEIAARAGVGVGSLYRRFPSKEALAYRLCLDGMSALADLARRTIEVIDDDPWEHFVAFIGDAVDAGAG